MRHETTRDILFCVCIIVLLDGLGYEWWPISDHGPTILSSSFTSSHQCIPDLGGIESGLYSITTRQLGFTYLSAE